MPGGDCSCTSVAPRHLAQLARDVARRVVEHVEIVAVEVDDDRGGVARQRFLDALGQERLQREVDAGKAGEHLAHLGLRLVGFRARQIALQVDLELAVVRAPGVVRLLGAPDALRDDAHERQLQAAPW